MSLIDLGKNDVSEETQALKDRLASRDTECAGLRTQLMRCEVELEELRVTLNETVYKLSKEAERALHLEEEVSTQSSELKTERISLRNTELALQSAQDKLKAEERAKRELESTLDTVSLHSQTTHAEHQSVQREKRALESRVRELERIVQTHESRRVSHTHPKGGRPRSSSVSNFRLPVIEQELNDTKTQLHTTEMKLRTLEQKLTQAQDGLVKAENACISIDKTSQKRISELLETLGMKEEELESLRETDNTGEREEELLKRIDEDAAKIAALEKLVADGQAARISQARIQKLQSQLKAECEKVHRSENLQSQLLQEKEELVRKYEASQLETRENHELLIARERQIEELRAKHAHLVVELDACRREALILNAEHASSHSQRSNEVTTFANDSALADQIQAMLHAIDRLRTERDSLKRALEFSEVEYRITTEGFEARIASLTNRLTRSAYPVTSDKSPIDEHMEQRTKQLTLCAAAFSVVISNLQTRLDRSEDRLSATIVDLTSSNSRLHDALATIDNKKQLLTNVHENEILCKLDALSKELSESNEERNRLSLQLADMEGQAATMMRRAEASEAARKEAQQCLFLAEERLATFDKKYLDMESERNSLALQITNLQDDLDLVRDNLADAQTRYNALHAQRLSEMSTSGVVQALKGRIQELEACIVHYTDQINDDRHDINQLEVNIKLHEERIAEMAPELELLASEKEAMVEDCAEAREARDNAIQRSEAAEERAEQFQQQLQQMKQAHDAELSAMSLMVENLTLENQQTTVRLRNLEAANAEFGRELDNLGRDHEHVNEQLNVAVSRSRSQELEVSIEKTELQQAIVSCIVVHRAYRDSVRQLQRSYQHVTILNSKLAVLSKDLEEKRALIDNAEEENHVLLQRLSDIGTTITPDGLTSCSHLSMAPEDALAGLQHGEVHQDDREIELLRDALHAKEQELAIARQMLDETQCRYSETEAELVERITILTTDLQVQAGQADRAVNLQAEVENLRIQLQNSQENFSDLEKLHCDVIRELTAVKDAFESRLTETTEQIRTLDADHQQSLSVIEAEYGHDISVLTSNLEDREHEVEELRQELQDLSEAHTRAEGKLRDELKSFEAQTALANDLEKDLGQSIIDMRRRLTQAETEALVLHEERQLLQVEVTGLQAEIQRSSSLTRYLESQIRESEDACMLLREKLQQSELGLVELEKASKAAEFNLTLQSTQHEKVVMALRREIASLQSGPDLRSALADLEQKNREMDDLLRAKCQEIEEYDDRILETLKANKKLISRVESLTRKAQALQAKLSLMKNQPQEPSARVTPPKMSSTTAPAPETTQAESYPSSAHVRESSAPSLPLRSKTPEPRAQPPAVHTTPGGLSGPFGCGTSTGKKRRAPDDDERDSVPAEGHYSTDSCFRNGPTPRLRRAHGHPPGFTPVRGASSRKPTESPGRRANVVTASDIITDVTNSPRAPSRQGDAQLKKKSWLGKIRGGTGPQHASSRLGTFGGQ